MTNKNSISKQLREQFATKKKSVSINPAEILGIMATDMQAIIIADIKAMLKKNYRQALEGYIFCLSKIIKHNVAWECILRAFSEQGEIVPRKYYSQFGQSPN